MKIGYAVEGATDRALMRGLQRRWYPYAELIEGRFRGTTRQSARREIPNTCLELVSKGADMIVFLRDANAEDWREVLAAEEARCHPQHKHLAVFGVCERNIESWLCADPSWLAARVGGKPDEFRLDDLKGVFQSALGITGTDKKEAEIADLVEHAPLKNWLANRSFEDFYDKLWRMGKALPGSSIENLRERKT